MVLVVPSGSGPSCAESAYTERPANGSQLAALAIVTVAGTLLALITFIQTAFSMPGKK